MHLSSNLTDGTRNKHGIFFLLIESIINVLSYENLIKNYRAKKNYSLKLKVTILTQSQIQHVSN